MQSLDLASEQIPDQDVEPKLSESWGKEKWCDLCMGFRFVFLTEAVGTIRESAAEGCFYCDLLLKTIEEYAANVDDEVDFTARWHESTIDIDYPSGLERRGGHLPDTRITLYGQPNGDYARFGVGGFLPLPLPKVNSVAGDTSSLKAQASAQRWLEKCTVWHTLCGEPFAKPLPVRVLQLYGRNNGRNLRLYETQGGSGRYCCLSHCWGGAKFMRLTKDNEQQLKSQIQWELLPKTFRDAVIFTYDLGVRYLWIDSLCIIQDDDEDWQRESLSMHTYYRNAYLTLAASKSTGPHDGMYVSTGAEFELRQVSITNTSGVDVTVLTRRAISHFDRPQDFPLMKRGWVFQERILSPRVLHFGPQELLWECMENRSCECGFPNTFNMRVEAKWTYLAMAWEGPYEEKEESISGTFAKASPPDEEEEQISVEKDGKSENNEERKRNHSDGEDGVDDGKETDDGGGGGHNDDDDDDDDGGEEEEEEGGGGGGGGGGEGEEEEEEEGEEEEWSGEEGGGAIHLSRPNHFSTLWQKTVSDYSRLLLSMDKDIFPAISGIAQQQKTFRVSNYLAGLWEDTLETDLMWHTTSNFARPWNIHEKRLAARPTKWRAPTWSWASIKSPVEFHKYAEFFSSIEMAFFIKPLTNNFTGELREALLRMHCLLAPTTFRYCAPKHEDFKVNASRRGDDAFLYYQDAIIDIHCTVDYNLRADGPGHIADGSTIYCLKLGTSSAPGLENGSVEVKTCFLLLRKLERPKGVDWEHARYERIGFGKSEKGRDSLRGFRRSLKSETIIII